MTSHNSFLNISAYPTLTLLHYDGKNIDNLFINPH